MGAISGLVWGNRRSRLQKLLNWGRSRGTAKKKLQKTWKSRILQFLRDVVRYPWVNSQIGFPSPEDAGNVLYWIPLAPDFYCVWEGHRSSPRSFVRKWRGDFRRYEKGTLAIRGVGVGPT